MFLKLAIAFPYLLLNVFCFLNEVKGPKRYVITHEHIFDWDVKSKTFEKYTGCWPPEKTQIKGVEESILEVSPNKLEIKKYYHHTYCSELTQTFVLKAANKASKPLELSAAYTENGVYENCDGVH